MPINMTIEQECKLLEKYKQAQQGVGLEDFLETVQPTFGMDGAVVVRWSGMWLCIEADGYCHT